jgi:uncharacterized protein
MGRRQGSFQSSQARISFEIAQHVFEDSDALVEQDRIVDGERRWQTLGTVGDVLLLLVAHTVDLEEDESAEIVRIISARRANRKERKRYEEERQKNYS